MAASSAAITNNFALTTPFGAGVLSLESFEGYEEISGLFQFHLRMSASQEDLAFDTILGQKICITISLPSGDSQYIHAVVTSFSQAETSPQSTTYLVRVEPWLALLKMKTDFRIFQNKTVPDIITQIFSDAGMSDYKNNLKGTYQPREYCVQYGESCFDFVSRLMESEGIFYFFEHSSSAHTLVLADSSDSYTDVPGIQGIHFWQTGRNWESIDALLSGEITKQVIPGKYTSDDYNFEMPSTDLLTTVEGDNTKLSIYEYPGNYAKKDQGDTIANLRLTALEVEGNVFRGESMCSAFHVACKFTLTDHPRSDANTSYVLRLINHRYSAQNYTNSFEAFPLTTVFRPPLKTSRPVAYGVHSAVVVGKSGEEIWTDQYGRIKVQFYWDQYGKNDENSSCWIRVAQQWAGKQWGSFYLPRIGQEVLVSFLDGNPDRPIVTGSVYNAEQVTPYTLPDDQTKSTLKSNSSKGGEGFNEILFQDKQGSEQLQIHAQKDMDIEVLNNYTQTVTKDYSLTVNGNLTIDVTGTISIKSGDSSTMEASTASTLKAGTSMTVQSGTDMSVKAGTSLQTEAGTTMDSKSNASTSVQSSGMVEIKGAMVKIN
jgi:type VI secretion system secreted protein VgrG